MACGMPGNRGLPDVQPHAPPAPRQDAPGISLTIAGTAEAVRQALRQLVASPVFLDLPQDLRSSAEIVLAEVLNNIVEHAYAACDGDIHLQLTFAAPTQTLACEIIDTGAPMPGLCLPAGQSQPLGALNDLPEGGFGWFLIRSLTERLQYDHAKGENRLTLCLSAGQSASQTNIVSN